MAQKLYEEANIQAIANALRAKYGDTKTAEDQTVYAKIYSSNASSHDTCPSYNTRPTVHDTKTECLHVPGAKSFVVCMTVDGTAYGYFYGGYVNVSSNSFPGSYETKSVRLGETMKTLVFDNTEYLTFKLYANANADYGKEGYYCEICALDQNGNSIDFNNGKTTVMTYEVPNTYRTSEMATAISALGNVGASATVLVSRNITSNGTYQALNDGADGYSSVIVNVPPNVAEKTINKAGVYTAAIDGYDGYSKVTVDLTNLQSKHVVISENGNHDIVADNGYDGLSNVTVTVGVAGSGGGGATTGIAIGSMSVNDFPVVYYSNDQILAKKTALQASTSSSAGSSNTYIWMADPNITVGENLMDKLKSDSHTTTSYREIGFYRTGTKDKPTWEKMRGIIVYNFDNVSLTGTADYYGKTVLYNDEGLVLYVGSLQGAVDALNTKAINLSQGVGWICTSTRSVYHTDSYSSYTNAIKFNAPATT